MLITTRRKATAIAVSAIVAMTAATTAVGAAVNSGGRKVTATGELLIFSTEHGYPAVGGSATLAGPIRQQPGGSGGEVDHVTITAHPAPNVLTARATGTDYLAHGSERHAFTSMITIEPDGSLKIAGSGTLTGGTDAYRGIKGHFSFTGGAPSPTGITTIHTTAVDR